MSLTKAIQGLKESLEKYRDALVFNMESAREIQRNSTHEKHSDYFNERYWHGFAVGLQYAKEQFEDRFRVSTKQRKGGEE